MRVISLRINNSVLWTRYYIVDQDENFYTGSGWDKNQKNACAFASHEEAATKVQALYKEQLKTKKNVQQFVLPIVFDVYSDRKVTDEELRNCLFNALKINFDYVSCGTGPGKDCGVVANTFPQQLKEFQDGFVDYRTGPIDTSWFGGF